MSAWRERVEIAGGRAVLYLGDNREVWPALGVRPDAIVTDPPYGIGFGAKHTKWSANRGTVLGDWDDQIPDVTPLLDAADHVIIWGGERFNLPVRRCWLTWVKPDAAPTFSSTELAWTSFDRPARHLIHSISATNAERVGHPTQKPERVMEWCIGLLPESARVVADPYMGSGTTGVACMRRGCRFIGIEIDEGYFRTACRRISEAARQPDLLIPETAA